MKTVNNSQIIFDRAAEARIFLHIHGFIGEAEKDKIKRRINDYGTRRKVNFFKDKKAPSKEEEA